MKCEHCGSDGAEIHLVKIINGERHIEYLCAKCAKEFLPFEDTSRMLKMTLSIEGISELQEILKEMLLPDFSDLSIENGNGYKGKLTQEDMFENFTKEHADFYSKEEAESSDEDPLRQLGYDELTDLKNELKLAVRDERYERAAVIRDRIRELEKTEGAK
jgi:protein arginine kinase activator